MNYSKTKNRMTIFLSILCVISLSLSGCSQKKPVKTQKETEKKTDSAIKKKEETQKKKTEETKKTNTTNTGEKICYITIDDGPTNVTPHILDVLDKYNVKATFFVIGATSKYSHYIKNIKERGHAIGAHSYSHDYKYIYASKENFYKDFNKIQTLIKKYTGTDTKLFRFPGGSSNAISKKYCKGIMTYLTKDLLKKGYNYVDWNVSTGDATLKPLSKAKLLRNIKTNQKNVVLLMHDRPESSAYQNLSSIIEYYKNQGYTFKTLDQTNYTFHHQVNN